jgi:hypothetical protein
VFFKKSLWWERFLISLKLLGHHVVCLENLFDFLEQFDASIHWRHRVVYFYSSCGPRMCATVSTNPRKARDECTPLLLQQHRCNPSRTWTLLLPYIICQMTCILRARKRILNPRFSAYLEVIFKILIPYIQDLLWQRLHSTHLRTTKRKPILTHKHKQNISFCTALNSLPIQSVSVAGAVTSRVRNPPERN